MKRLKLPRSGKPTKKQRKKFYQFALGIYTNALDETEVHVAFQCDLHYLQTLGFCGLQRNFFNIDSPDLYSLIELRPYSKKYEIYRYWFPRGHNEERIKILQEILSKM